MAATPQYGTMVFKGQSGRTYEIDIYLSDVTATPVRWDEGAGAGAASQTFWQAPERVVLIDYAQVTGTADTTKMRVTANGAPTPNILRYSIHLTTLNNRPPLNIGFNAGTRVGAIQQT